MNPKSYPNTTFPTPNSEEPVRFHAEVLSEKPDESWIRSHILVEDPTLHRSTLDGLRRQMTHFGKLNIVRLSFLSETHAEVSTNYSAMWFVKENGVWKYRGYGAS